MRRIAFLACETTLPGGPRRRDDAHEHDQEVAALRPACAALDIEVVEIDWEADTDWSIFDAAVIRTTWNYQDRVGQFLAALRAIDAVTPVWNPPALVEWNLDKRYLRTLEQAGVPTIPTVWIDDPTPDALASARADLGGDVVVKRQVGAGANGQLRLGPDDPVAGPVPHRPVLVQPFVPTVIDEGEWSFVFVDADLSHALVKVPAAGDYRVQSLYGGVERAAVPSATDRDAAEAVVAALDDVPLYSRVDMVRVGDQLSLMELEVVEPFLYPIQGPELGSRLAAAIDRRLG